MLVLPLAALFAFQAGSGVLPSYRDVARERSLLDRNLFGTEAKTLITETTGSGGAFFDYDGDGDVDLYIVNGRETPDVPGPPNRLLRNRGDGTFEDVTAEAGVGDRGWGGGAAAADFDNDGDIDLLVTNDGPNVLFRNRGDGTFEDVAERAGLLDARWSTSAAFADLDGDGFLDLYVANYIAFEPSVLAGLDPNFCLWRGIPVMCGPNGLPGEQDALYRNRGDGTFEDVTRHAGVDNPDGKGLGVVVVDFDEDGDQDLYVANDSTPDFLYQNDGAGRFSDVALLAGVAVSMYGKAQAGMGADAGDYDGDGRPDLFVTNFQGDYNALRRNDGMGLFTDVSDQAGLTAPSFERLGWGARFVDVDLDGRLDLFVANGHVYPEVDSGGIGESYRQPNQVFRNRGDGRFEDVSEAVGLGAGGAPARSSRGLALGDIDDDRDLDVFVNNVSDVPTLLVDEADHGESFLRLTLVGRESSRDGLEAWVELDLDVDLESGAGAVTLRRAAASIWSYLSTNDRRLLVGLGGAGSAEVTIHWPSGAQALGLIAAGQDIVVLEGVGRLR